MRGRVTEGHLLYHSDSAVLRPLCDFAVSGISQTDVKQLGPGEMLGQTQGDSAFMTPWSVVSGVDTFCHCAR